MHHDVFRYPIFLLAVLCLCSCANKPDTDAEQEARIKTLARQLQALTPDATEREAMKFAGTAVKSAANLRTEYRVNLIPWLHNIEVNSGIKPRGLCFHYARDLAKTLQTASAPHWQLHFVQARAKQMLEHNAIVVTAKGQSWDTGIVLDGWRNAGVLYFGPVLQDKYPWKLKVKPATTTSGHRE